MSKSFSLPLLAALPVLLASCSHDMAGYSRRPYSSYAECTSANRPLIAQGLGTPCQARGGGGYYGPYVRVAGGATRYVGYTTGGGLARTGLTLDSARGTYSTFRAPVSRGGFTTSARAGTGSS